MSSIDIQQIIKQFTADPYSFYFLAGVLVALILCLLAISNRIRELKRVRETNFLSDALLIIFLMNVIVSTYLLIEFYRFRYPRQVVEKNQTKILQKYQNKILPNTFWVEEHLEIFYIENNKLASIQANTTDEKIIYEAKDNIREYHFSPDGKFILIVTETELINFDRQNRKPKVIDSFKTQLKGEAQKGVIRAVVWSPQSDKFCYELSRWSTYASQKSFYIYETKTAKKTSLKSLSLKTHSLWWDVDGQNIYYFGFEDKQASVDKQLHAIKVFRIPLATLQPEFVKKIPFYRPQVSLEQLELRDINLFKGPLKLSFGRAAAQESMWRNEEQRLEIDKLDFLYYINDKRNRKKVFQIPRYQIKSDIERYQYQGGELAVQYLRWLPSGRYVIFLDEKIGVIILEPATGRMGHLTYTKGNTFGWYQSQDKF